MSTITITLSTELGSLLEAYRQRRGAALGISKIDERMALLQLLQCGLDREFVAESEPSATSTDGRETLGSLGLKGTPTDRQPGPRNEPRTRRRPHFTAASPPQVNGSDGHGRHESCPQVTWAEDEQLMRSRSQALDSPAVVRSIFGKPIVRT
jgi:hypothetical protein